MDNLSKPVKWLTLLIFLYGGLVLYASLMPYDFTSKVDLYQLLHEKIWKVWPFETQARISGSDFVSNLLLYFPLGFLAATRYRFVQLNRLVTLLLTFLLCSGLSLFVEILQGLTVSRIPSATDWFLNSISGFWGAIIGVIYGYDLWRKSTTWVKNRWLNCPLDILTLIYMVLLVAEAFSPFLPTILLSQVRRNFKNSHFSIIEGLSQHSWDYWLITRILVYMVLTFLIVAWGRNKHLRWNWNKAAIITTIFSIALEMAKLIIVSRHFNIANIISAIGGVILALGLGRLVLYLFQQKT